MTIEELRRRIELVMNERYAGCSDTASTRARIDADMALLHDVFPELDITAEVTEDRHRVPFAETLDRLQALWRR